MKIATVSIQTDLMLDNGSQKRFPDQQVHPENLSGIQILMPHPSSTDPDTLRMGAWDSVLINDSAAQ